MELNFKRLRGAGFTEGEIRRVQEYVAERPFNNRGTFDWLNGDVRPVCWTIAEILDQLRPGIWLREED